MIELAQLAASAVALLAPLLGKAADKAAAELGKSAATQMVDKLKSKLSHTGAKEALEDLSKQPAEADAQAALRWQLQKALASDPDLVEVIKTWLTESESQAAAAGVHQTATVQGDHNKVIQVSGTGNMTQS